MCGYENNVDIFEPPKIWPTAWPTFFHGVLEPKLSKNKMSYQIISVTSWCSDNFDMIWYKSLMILYRCPLPSLSASHSELNP